MMVPVEAHIDSDLLEDEYFNFSVRMYGSTSLSPRAGIQFAVPISGACSFGVGSRRRVGSGKCSPNICCTYCCCGR